MTELLPGTLIDRRYRVRREIACGGMCVVYCAAHEVTARPLAIKVLREDLAHDETARRRLVREAQALEAARCPYVVDLVDACFLDSGLPYIVLEMIEGRTLEGILTTRRTLSPHDTTLVGIHLCRALARVHAAHYVHRDIKPGNVIITKNHRGESLAKLIDFGIAAPTVPTPGPAAVAACRITRAGEFYGTPEYIAPEAVQNQDVLDKRSDIFALGITLFECLAGRPPFDGGFADVTFKVITEGVPDVRTLAPHVPASLAAVLARAVASEPADRFVQLADMQESLERVRDELAESRKGREEAAQRRKFLRCAYVTPVQIVLPDGVLVFGRSEDISEGGLLVVAAQPCPDDTPVGVKFMTPVSGGVASVQAVTRWVRSARDRTAIGLEFQDLPESFRAEIATFVQQVVPS